MSLGKDLIQAAKEAVAIARGGGGADPATYRVHVPADIDVRAIRRGTGMTQAAFAQAFGFSAASVRDWEQGRRRPDSGMRAYLMTIRRDHAAVLRLLAEPEAA